MDQSLKNSDKVSDTIDFKHLISLCSKEELCYMYTGYFFAFLSGAGQPVTLVLFGRTMGRGGEVDTTGPNAQMNVHEARAEQFNDTFNMVMILLGVGVFNWITAFGFQTSLSIFAEKCARRIRVAYLKAIFRQDAQWFDNINYMELSSNIAKQSAAIQSDVGSKWGNYSGPTLNCYPVSYWVS